MTGTKNSAFVEEAKAVLSKMIASARVVPTPLPAGINITPWALPPTRSVESMRATLVGLVEKGDVSIQTRDLRALSPESIKMIYSALSKIEKDKALEEYEF